jgi:hypothetical protein
VRSMFVGQLSGMGAEQGHWDGLRYQVSGQGEQHQRSRGLGSQPVKGNPDAGGQRYRICGRGALRQQLCGPLGEQGEVVLNAGGGIGQVRSDLGQRQRQVSQRLSDPPRFIVAQL